ADCNRTWKALRSGIAVEMFAARSALGRRAGPCRGLASLMRAQRPLPEGRSWEKAAMRRPERQPQRSLRQSASVVSSPPLYRMCHNVPVSGILADKIIVSLTTKRVNHIVTRHAAPFCTVLSVGAPKTAVNSVMLRLRPVGRAL